MTVHNSDLDRAILAAVHTDVPHADAVAFKVLTRGEDNTPTLYEVTASRAGSRFISRRTTPTEALERAMLLLKAEAGHGPYRTVDFASIELTGEVTS
jgi:hypothetical protein